MPHAVMDAPLIPLSPRPLCALLALSSPRVCMRVLRCVCLERQAGVTPLDFARQRTDHVMEAVLEKADGTAT